MKGKDYVFAVQPSLSMGHPEYRVVFCPGEREYRDQVVISRTSGDLFRCVAMWVKALTAEMHFLPQLEEHLALMGSVSVLTIPLTGERFSKEEEAQMRARLDAVEQQLKAQAKNAEEIAALHAKIDELRASLKTQTPSAWMDQARGALAILLIQNGWNQAKILVSSVMDTITGAGGG